MVRKLLYLLLLFSAITSLPSNIMAEEISLSLKVSPESGTTADAFLFSVIVSGGPADGFPYLTGGEDFTLTLLGPETSMSVINGVENYSVNYRYQLLPKRAGTLLTPGAELAVGGKVIRAESLTVKVAAGSKSAAPSTKEPSFLTQSASPTSVVQGQQIINTIQLYTNQRLQNITPGDLTSAGFVQYALGTESQSRRVLNGIAYNVITLRRSLFPLTSGKLTLPARGMTAQVRVLSRGLFDPFDPFRDMFNQSAAREVQLQSNTLEINVTPLPIAPKDLPNWRDSSPIVGMTSIRIVTEPSRPSIELNTGESVTVTATVVSTGNLAPLNTLPLGKDSRVEVYDESPKERMFENSGVLFTEKIFRYSIVPQEPGTISLPPVSIGFYDPEKAEYRVAQQSLPTLLVTGPSRRPVVIPTIAENQIKQPATFDKTLPTPVPQIPVYREDSWLRQLSNDISTGLAILIVTGFLALFGVVAFVFLLLSKRKERSKYRKQLKRAVNSHDVLVAFELLTKEKLEELENPLPLSQIIQGSSLSDEEKFKLIQLYDSLQECVWGEKNSEIKELQRAALVVLSKL